MDTSRNHRQCTADECNHWDIEWPGEISLQVVLDPSLTNIHGEGLKHRWSEEREERLIRGGEGIIFIYYAVTYYFLYRSTTVTGLFHKDTNLRQDPLDLSFWSFLTFLHHGIEEEERHLLWKCYENSKEKLVKCATEVARLRRVSIQSCTQNRPSPKVQSLSRDWI